MLYTGYAVPFTAFYGECYTDWYTTSCGLRRWSVLHAASTYAMNHNVLLQSTDCRHDTLTRVWAKV